jgi:glycosyltransferase involved in cell wall biosynthesis
MPIEHSLNKNMPLRFFVTANVAGGGLLQPGLSGGDRIALESLKRWAAWGSVLTIFTSTSGQSRYQRYLQPSANVRYNVIKTPAFRKNNLATIALHTFFSLIKGIIAALRIRGLSTFDIICSPSDFWPDSIPGWIMKMRNMNATWIASCFLFVPNPFSRESSYKGLRRFKGLLYYLSQKPVCLLIQKYADMVWVTNELDRWRFIDGKRLTTDNVVAIKGGVDAKTPLLIPEPIAKKFDAIFIGRLVPEKGVLELIDAWKYVCEKKKDAKLAILGLGPLNNQIQNKIKQNGLFGNVKTFGFVDGVEKLKIIKESKVVVHPSIMDSGGMAACEAMACGLPGVSFDLESLKVYYPKGMFKVPCYDLKIFANTILKLLEDESFYQRLSKEAINFAKNWDWDKMAEDTLNKVRKVIINVN